MRINVYLPCGSPQSKQLEELGFKYCKKDLRYEKQAKINLDDQLGTFLKELTLEGIKVDKDGDPV